MGIEEKYAKKRKRFRNFVVGATALSLVGGGVVVGNYITKEETPRAAYAAQAETAHDNDTIILTLKKGKGLKHVNLLHDDTDSYEFNKTTRLSSGLVNTYVVDPTKASDKHLDQIVADLRADGDVVSAEFNLMYSIPDLKVNKTIPSKPSKEGPNDPLYKKGKLWGQTATGMDRIHEVYKGADLKKVVVAVLDTGISPHEDLKLTREAKDGHGHGTHCAGTIAGVTNNGVGVSSINHGNIELRAYKVLTDSGSGSIGGIAKAIIKSTDDGADVISMSLGGPGKSRVLEDAVKYAQKKGVIVVAAAGNSNDNAENHSPANIDDVITVAAVGLDGNKVKRASFSSYGKIVEVAAPGVDIHSTLPKSSRMGKNYGSANGTSMATPHTAGTVAAMLSVNYDLRGNVKKVVQIMQETGSDPITEKGKDIGKFINSYEAVKKARSLRD